MIYLGTCGFSYKEWIGPFYPSKTKSAEMLQIYARDFPAVEIDSSYYGVPAQRTVESFAARTPPGFRFSFKVPQTVTHRADVSSIRVHDDAALLREALAPMQESGKLACVLAQFPNGFGPEERNETYVARVVKAFEGLPVVVEFRNRLWQRPHTLALLERLGAGYANVDMPRLDGLLTPSSDVVGCIGYVRFHGRNAKTWWSGTNVTRYRYAYSTTELEPWTDRIAEIEAQSSDTYVFFNNHANGAAPQDARTLLAMLDDCYGSQADSHIARAAVTNGAIQQSLGIEP